MKHKQNKPVAYMMESPSAKWFLLEPDECLPNETCTPLYTHSMSELTEDEMIEYVFAPINPPHAGSWVIGGNFHINIREKPTEEHIKNTELWFGWKWKDA